MRTSELTEEIIPLGSSSSAPIPPMSPRVPSSPLTQPARARRIEVPTPSRTSEDQAENITPTAMPPGSPPERESLENEIRDALGGTINNAGTLSTTQSSSSIAERDFGNTS